MSMCSLVTPSRCISLETGLVLNSDYIKQFSFFVCVFVSVCVCVLLLSLLMFPADWLMFKQLHKRCVWRISCSVYIFAGWWPVCRCDEQKTHYWCIRSASSISFLLHWIISYKGGCMSIGKLWLYLRGKEEFWTFRLSGALLSHCFCSSHRHTGHHPTKMYTEQEILQTHLLCSCLNINQSARNISKDNSNTEKKIKRPNIFTISNQTSLEGNATWSCYKRAH